MTVRLQAGTLGPRLLFGEFIPTRILGRLLVRVPLVPTRETNRELRQSCMPQRTVGGHLEWDWAAMRLTGSERANQDVDLPYRGQWT